MVLVSRKKLEEIFSIKSLSVKWYVMNLEFQRSNMAEKRREIA